MPKQARSILDGIKYIGELNRTLQEIDVLLSDGEKYPDKLPELARLLVPGCGDWCCIHLVDPKGAVEQQAVAPPGIKGSQGIYDWMQNDLPNDEADGLPAVVLSKKTILVAQVNPVRRAAQAGIHSYMIVPLLAHDQVRGALNFILSGPERHYKLPTVSLAENLALHISAFLEKSQLHHDTERRNAQLERRVGEGSAVLEETLAQLKQSEEVNQTLFRVSNKLNATLDVNAILDALAQEAIQIVNGESGFAGLRTEQGMNVHKYFQDGVAIPFEHTWALGEGIPGWVLKYKVPYGTSDAENDPLIRRDLALNTNVHTVICTPILDTTGEVIAYFDIRNKKGEEGFTINDQEMLLTLAPVASMAIQNALAYQQRLATVNELTESSRQLQELAASLETAREEERVMVARELHDELGQALTALKFDLAWLSEQLEHSDETLAQKARDITSQANTLIKMVRRIATELRPGMLEDLGLAASIEWQAHDFEKRAGITCQLNLPGEDLGLTHDQSLAIYRILQEALTNVARYAHASQVEVSLQKAGETLSLVIHDDGEGVDPGAATNSHSLGLTGMRERAKHLGGSFDIKGEPGQGTTVRVTLPLRGQT